MSGEGEGEPLIHGVPPGADDSTIGGSSTAAEGGPGAEKGEGNDANNHHNDHNNINVDENNDTHNDENNDNNNDDGNGAKDGWEAARAWLWTLPRRRNVMRNEIEEWLQANKHTLSREIVTMPRQPLYRYLVAQHKLIRHSKEPISPSRQVGSAGWPEPPTARFKRSDKWKPIYSWLESLNSSEIVRTRAIVGWLSENPNVKEELQSKHSRYHLIHYIQKCHAKILKKRGKLSKEVVSTNIQNNLMRPSGALKDKYLPIKGSQMQRGMASVKHHCDSIDGPPMDNRNSDAVLGNVALKPDFDGGEVIPTNNFLGFNHIDVHSKMLKNCDRAEEEEQGTGVMPLALTVESGNVLKHSSEDADDLSSMGKDEALRRYELLSELQSRLIDLISKSKQQQGSRYVSNCGPHTIREIGSTSLFIQGSTERNGVQSSEVNDDADGRLRRRLRDSMSSQQGLASHSITAQIKSRSSGDAKIGRKRKRVKDSMDISNYAWSRCEASTDIRLSELARRSGREEEETKSSSDIYTCITKSQIIFQAVANKAFSKGYKPNIVKCVQGREGGLSWPLTSVPNGYCGKRQQNWKSLFEGWDSLGKQFQGPVVWLERKAYSSWTPTWSAYTSSVAVAQPFGRMDQSVQKVLDVRFHPHGLAQLVCSSNEAPNELLLYNLIAGRATELAGHNCQIQAVEYAAGGASIVSCGANLVKVWDSTSGACLYTMGSVAEDPDSVGHKKKINAMTVNRWQSCLVATSGGESDGQLLLWNVLTGELATDINVNIRKKHSVLPSIDAMEFCNQNLLVCGSDSAYGGPAIVQLWDIEAPQGCASFPAHDSYITSLKINPTCSTIITGAGDGTIGLFDIRTCGGISRFSIGSNFEVTSVSFSSCGTYFHASSTANATLVWDTRMMPMQHGLMPTERPIPVVDPTLHSVRSLHCLSHGKQMPTAENAGQLPGYVDQGDQGVNDARWLHNAPVLVTASGNGSIAMWNVTLGQPCIRHLSSHTRCTNTVAVAPNDEYICSGGDDQKVVLYHDLRGRSSTKWRLTHPLSDAQID